MQQGISKRVLVVEDDFSLAREIEKFLVKNGFETKVANSLAEGKEIYSKWMLDLVVLDVNLPDGLGFQFCEAIREEDSLLPVLFLTDKSDDETVVKGLSFETSDYMKKPFSRGELLVRMKRMLSLSNGVTKVGELAVNHEDKMAFWKGDIIPLSRREFEILSLLTRNIGRVVTRARMNENMLDGEVTDRTFSSYLSRLKDKLEKSLVTGIRIVTVYGDGYRLEKE